MVSARFSEHENIVPGHLDRQNVFGRATAVRWSDSVEPVPIPAVNFEGMTQFHILRSARLTTESRVDVDPGEFEILDVAVRLDDDSRPPVRGGLPFYLWHWNHGGHDSHHGGH